MAGVAPVDVDCNESAGVITVGSGKPLWNPGQTGIWWSDDNRDDTAFVTVFTPWRESEDLSGVPDNGRSDAREQQLAAQKTAVHEIGHVLNIGEADDDGTDEVYSGGSNDKTGENVAWAAGITVDEWSVMSGGTNEYQYKIQNDEVYFRFSIQELLTVSTADTKVEQ